VGIKHFVTSRTDKLFRDAVTGLVQDLGNKIPFILVNIVPEQLCDNCIFDPTHNCSSGVYNQRGPYPFTTSICPECKGAGKITYEQQTQIPRAIVKWGKVGDRQGDFPLPQGALPQNFGRARCLVMYNDQIDNADYFLVGGTRCKMVSHPIMRGLLTQVLSEVTFQRDD